MVMKSHCTFTFTLMNSKDFYLVYFGRYRAIKGTNINTCSRNVHTNNLY